MKQSVYWVIDGAQGAQAVLEKARKAVDADAPEAVLCRFPEEMSAAAKKEFLNAVRPYFQDKGVAFILRDNASLLKGCDGLHVSFSKDLAALRKKCGDLSLGVTCATRHEAMIAGEKGADYVAFAGENAAGLASWWADLFVVPCAVLSDEPCDAADFVMKPL